MGQIGNDADTGRHQAQTGSSGPWSELLDVEPRDGRLSNRLALLSLTGLTLLAWSFILAGLAVVLS